MLAEFRCVFLFFLFAQAFVRALAFVWEGEGGQIGIACKIGIRVLRGRTRKHSYRLGGVCVYGSRRAYRRAVEVLVQRFICSVMFSLSPLVYFKRIL